MPPANESVVKSYQNTLPSNSLVVVVVLLVLSGCATLPKDFERSENFAIQDTADTKIARDLAPLAAKYPEQSGVYLLNKGMDAFAARMALIETAEKSLDVQYYIWHHDLTGKVILQRLLVAANRGVRVRLLLDDLDTAGKDQILHTLDFHPSFEIRVFNPFANRNARTLDFIGDLSRVNHRMHNKSLTADYLATIVGGRNIGDEYFDATPDVGFTDWDVIGVGQIAKEVSGAFDEYWNSEWVYPLSAFKPAQPITEESLTAFEKSAEEFIEEARNSAYNEALKETSIARLSHVGELPFVWGRSVLVYDHPGKADTEEIKSDTHLGPKLRKAFESSQQELIVVSPYFVPGDAIVEFFVNLVERGVRVIILTNSLAANDVPLVHAGYMRYRDDLLRGGVELHEFKPTVIAGNREKKNNKYIGSSRASLHAKAFAIDQRYMFVGSFNLDPRSIALNTEMGVVFEAPEYAAALSKGFDELGEVKTYRLALQKKSPDSEAEQLVWHSRKDGEKIVYTKEPETSWWNRFVAGFMSLFVPESQL